MPTMEEQIAKLRAEVGALMTEQVLKDAEKSRQHRLEEIKRRKKEGAEWDAYIARRTMQGR